MNALEGGCTAPIGALARYNNGEIQFYGKLNSLDGTKTINIVEKFSYNETENYGEKFAEIILDKGGREMMQEIKKQIKS